MKSWRTTIIGLLTLIAAISTAAVALFDADPTTTITIEPILAALAGLGLLQARDHKVTSEEAIGADRARRQRSKAVPALFVGGIMIATVAGCGSIGGSQELGEASVRGQPTSTATMDVDGTQMATFQGTAPSNVKADAGGIWSTMQGAHATIVANPATGQLFINDPKNTTIARLTITPEPNPGEPRIVVEGLNANQSDVAEVYAAQFADAMQAISGMTQEQARAWIQAAVSAEQIIPSVARTLIQSFVPTLPQ